MDYDLNKVESYEHLMGKVQPSHLGSQSKSPAPEKDPGGYTETMMGSFQTGSMPSRGTPMPDGDE